MQLYEGLSAPPEKHSLTLITHSCMRKNSLLFVLALVLVSGAGCHKENVTVREEACSVITEVQSREVAQAALIGDWKWLQSKTLQPVGGPAPTIETPRTTGKQIIYRFTADRIIILENEQIVYDEPYAIRSTKTNAAELRVPLYFFSHCGLGPNYVPVYSVLHLDQGLSCMILRSSDNGELEMSFRRITASPSSR